MNKADKACLTGKQRNEHKQINIAWGDMVRILKDELGGWCEECGSAGNELEGHHITHKCFGGLCTRRNTIMLCPDCHDRMHWRKNYQRVDTVWLDIPRLALELRVRL